MSWATASMELKINQTQIKAIIAKGHSVRGDQNLTHTDHNIKIV